MTKVTQLERKPIFQRLFLYGSALVSTLLLAGHRGPQGHGSGCARTLER